MAYLVSGAKTRESKGYSGYTPILKQDDPGNATKIGLAAYAMKPQETLELQLALEAAFLLMRGEVEFAVGGQTATLKRNSLFNESASCVHAGMGEKLKITAIGEAEFTVYEIANTQPFPPSVHLPANVKNEHRGLGMVSNAAYRYVRTIFDGAATPPQCEMVLGEVVTFPGRWSSYPPHHHPQPEVYHYRFDKPQGYGHGEMGEQVYAIKNYDTLKIVDEKDHAQVAAPGYAMYYSWVIRHLPNNRYTVPEFTEEHGWTQQPGATSWVSNESKE